jgi:hypothetical protein
LLKYNNKCVYTWLMTCVSGKAKTKIGAVALAKSPKAAWDLLEANYNKRADLDVESLIMEWFKVNLAAFGSASEYMERMEVINNSLERRGKKIDAAQVMSKVKSDLIQDGRYKHIISASLLDKNTNYETLKAVIVSYDILTAFPSKSSKGRGKEEEKALTVSTADPAAPSREKKNFTRADGTTWFSGVFCIHCGVEGHWMKECMKKKAGKPQAPEGKKKEDEYRNKKKKKYSNVDLDKGETLEHARGLKELSSIFFIVDSGAHPTITPPHPSDLKPTRSGTLTLRPGGRFQSLNLSEGRLQHLPQKNRQKSQYLKMYPKLFSFWPTPA